MCKLLVVSRSGYYVWHVQPKSARAKQNAHLLDLIKNSYQAIGKTYGANRVFLIYERLDRHVAITDWLEP